MRNLSGRVRRMSQRIGHSRSKGVVGRATGFTIVEVVIVLAIAGFIMAMVFLAVPAAQRSIRNYDRKQAADYVFSEMESYKSEHGHWPFQTIPDIDNRMDFINGLSNGPAANFRIRYTDLGPFHDYPYANGPPDINDALDEISITPGHLCNQSGSPGEPDYPIQNIGTWGADFRGYAVYTLLEKAPMYCLDNDFERTTAP